MIFLQVLAFAYISVAAIMTLFIGFAIIKVGGFQEFTDFANMTAKNQGLDIEYTSTRVQWRVVQMVLFWPALPVYLALSKRG